MATEILPRLFVPDFHNNANFMTWRNMLLRTTQKGYARVSAAIRDTDMQTSSSCLTLPTLAVVGSQFGIIFYARHLPSVEKPDVLIDLFA
jgi:3-oxoadipate enol-lactonase